MNSLPVAVPELLPRLSSVKDALTVRAIACTVFLGSGVCLANMYFGLQAGMVNSMPMQNALLGFAVFRSIRHRLPKPLSPTETTFIEIVAGALGLAPFTSGLTSFIPALEFLATPAENGPIRFGLGRLLLWSVATGGLGIIAGAPFRNLFILRERLRYPSGTATGTLTGVLFRRGEITARAKPIDPVDVSRPPQLLESNPDLETREDEAGNENEVTSPRPAFASDDPDQGPDQDGNGYGINTLLYSLAVSALFSLVSYFLPILKRVPIFGFTAAKDWLWAFDLSPAYVGYGIIIGPIVNVYILLGAIIGWGVLSPVAKYNGWAPGLVGDWDDGSCGWILWVGMGLILGDTIVGLGWIILKPLLPWAWHMLEANFQRKERSSQPEAADQVPLLRDASEVYNGENDTPTVSIADDDWPNHSIVTTALVLWVGAALFVLYLTSLLVAFQALVPIFAALFAVMLIPLAGFISMRSLGETDNGSGLAIGRLAQFAIALVLPASSQSYTSVNLLLGGAIESCASQASQQMGGFKTAHMTRTAPRAVFYGEMIGSYIGALIAVVVYKILTSLKTVPSEEFSVPDAHLYLVASRLIRQQGLPPRAMNLALWAFALDVVFSTLRIVAGKRWWQNLAPSGVAMGIGMYVVPAITLPRALGGLILVVGRRRLGMEHFILICSATGLILGQGLFSLVALLFDALRVPTGGAY